jgi:putative peptidoglycan lipid II flippase
VRELLMAAAFGASALTDAFNVAFRIPNLLRRLFAEGAFSQAFVPVLAASKEKDGETKPPASWSVQCGHGAGLGAAG